LTRTTHFLEGRLRAARVSVFPESVAVTRPPALRMSTDSDRGGRVSFVANGVEMTRGIHLEACYL
jgi:hypothetical protein